ncbi:hypothetical protein PCAR4_440033 [Paraburkholderia caribensis]|nr:hypothetical protein PCAR4_440033 [Paraburkholderia caribensis]
MVYLIESALLMRPNTCESVHIHAGARESTRIICEKLYCCLQRNKRLFNARQAFN